MSDLTARVLEMIRSACAAGKDDPERVAGAMGLSLRAGYRGYAEVEPLPQGVGSVILGLEDEGGPVRFVQVTLDDAAIVALKDIEAMLTGKQFYAPGDRGEAERYVYDLAGPSGGRACRVALDLRPGEGSAHDRFVVGVQIVL